MHKYQVLIEYVGTNFIGWQIQSKGKSIQKLIQNKLSKLLKEKISLIGSGRTDAGVHAIEQSAHFECKKKIQNLNKFLKSIKVLEIQRQGKRPQSISEFMLGSQIKKGSNLYNA